MNFVTIDGDRQTGKSHAAQSILVNGALSGDRIVFYGDNLIAVQDMFHRVEKVLPRDLVDRVCRANGRNAIHMKNLGALYFRSWRQESITRGITTAILDDRPEGLDLNRFLQTHCVAQFVYVINRAIE